MHLHNVTRFHENTCCLNVTVDFARVSPQSEAAERYRFIWTKGSLHR